MKQYVHKESGRVFTTLSDLHIAEKAWTKRYGGKTSLEVEAEKQRIERLIQHQARIAEQRRIEEEYRKYKQKKKDDLKKEINILEEEKIKWYTLRDINVQIAVQAQAQTISDLETQVKKLQLALSLHKKAFKNFKKEATEEWEKKNPFPLEKKLRNFRNKLYKL